MTLKTCLNLTALAFLVMLITFSSKADPQKMYGIQGHKFSIATKTETPKTYSVKGQIYITKNGDDAKSYSKEGIASYYHLKFNGRKTASGDVYNSTHFTAAHKTLPINSYALVTNLHNNRKVIVRINDRGPFSEKRIIDLSHAAAKELGLIARGTGQVRIEALHLSKNGELSGAGVESLAKHAKTQEAVERLNTKPKMNTSSGVTKNVLSHILKIPAFKSRKQAETFILKAGLQGVKSSVIPFGKQFEIRFGPFDSKKKLAQAKKKLQKIAKKYSLVIYND